jgi:hypothetical protein
LVPSLVVSGPRRCRRLRQATRAPQSAVARLHRSETTAKAGQDGEADEPLVMRGRSDCGTGRFHRPRCTMLFTAQIQLSSGGPCCHAGRPPVISAAEREPSQAARPYSDCSIDRPRSSLGEFDARNAVLSSKSLIYKSFRCPKLDVINGSNRCRLTGGQ